MKYLSDYALGEKFIVTPDIAEKLGYPFTEYLNAKCYVDEIRIGICKCYVSIALLEDYINENIKRSKHHTITTFSYTIDDYYKNQNLVHTISAVYGVRRSPFRFRTAVFRSQRPPIF